MFSKGLGGMMKQALEMKGRIEEMKESLRDEKVEATSGGGMVKVVMNGRLEVESIDIEADIIADGDKEMIETLVCAAFNSAMQQVQELMKARMSDITGGLDIPGITS